MKFLVDMPLSPSLADWLNARGYEAVHASRIGLEKASDEDVLRRAAKDEGIVIACDLDFPRLLALAEAKGPSIILLRGGNYSDAEVITILERVLGSVSEQDLAHAITVVDHRGLRRHRLPLRPAP